MAIGQEIASAVSKGTESPAAKRLFDEGLGKLIRLIADDGSAVNRACLLDRHLMLCSIVETWF
jgi:hypothetical protein